MEVKEVILKEIERVPEQYLAEILDFIRFLAGKSLEESKETAIASETSLKKDWLKPEEDEAWRDL
jgi:phosphoribosyl-ATP pyrophosphohydrolase